MPPIKRRSGMYIIRKKFKFEMAHQLISAFSECCKNCIHGHTYTLEVFLKSEELDRNGMVVDFGEVKERLKELINSFDHALVMSKDFNKEYLDILKKYNKKLIIVDYNSTAENMCEDLYYKIKTLLCDNNNIMDLYKVRLHETDTGYAEYYEDFE